MRKLLVGVVVGALGFFAWQRAHTPGVNPAANSAPRGVPAYDSAPVERLGRAFRCDGRVYCSQMTSCEEATWFLKNCPGVKMDGEGDGVPCESQWCGPH